MSAGDLCRPYYKY